MDVGSWLLEEGGGTGKRDSAEKFEHFPPLTLPLFRREVCRDKPPQGHSTAPSNSPACLWLCGCTSPMEETIHSTSLPFLPAILPCSVLFCSVLSASPLYFLLSLFLLLFFVLNHSPLYLELIMILTIPPPPPLPTTSTTPASKFSLGLPPPPCS